MSIWEEVKNRIAIEEVIGEYVQLTPVGQNYRCLSPFRQERTPSLIVSPSKKIWHDFGSGEGGDVFEFVARMENISRFEALKKLAQRVGLHIDQTTKTKQSTAIENSFPSKLDEFSQGLQLLAWVARLYHQILLKILKNRQHPVTAYCLKRGLAETAILNFQIGYAPKDNFLLALAKKHQLNLDLLVAIGVLKLSSDQQTYKDKFVDRLMIPIKDQAGRVVGFTGRVLDYDTADRPKYLNSPQTQWFNKSQIWFGWDLARKAIVQNRTAILVEGNLDVITAHSFGLTNTIASQGTSFTELQLKFLKNYAQTLWLAFDNDDAGQIAGQKLFIQATKFGFQTKKLIIPKPYKDLDEYLRAELGQAISNQILLDKLSVIDFLDWKIEQMSDQLTNTDLSRQRQATWEILELLAYTDPLSGEQYIRKLSQLTNFSQSTLLAEVNNLKNNFDLKPQSLRAEEPENLGAKNIVKQILQAWQMLCSYFLYAKNQTLIDQQFLTSLFFLLHKFVDALSDYPTLEAYLQANQANLELIWEYKHQEITTDLIVQITKSLLFYLDQKIGLLKLNTDELLMYSEIKKRLQNQ